MLRGYENLSFLRKPHAAEKSKMLQHYPFQRGNAQSRNTWLVMFSERRWRKVGVCHHIMLKPATEHKSPGFFSGLPRMSPHRPSHPFHPGALSLAAAMADFKQHLLKCAASSSAKPSHQQPFLLLWARPWPCYLGIPTYLLSRVWAHIIAH